MAGDFWGNTLRVLNWYQNVSKHIGCHLCRTLFGCLDSVDAFNSEHCQPAVGCSDRKIADGCIALKVNSPEKNRTPNRKWRGIYWSGGTSPFFCSSSIIYRAINPGSRGFMGFHPGSLLLACEKGLQWEIAVQLLEDMSGDLRFGGDPGSTNDRRGSHLLDGVKTS